MGSTSGNTIVNNIIENNRQYGLQISLSSNDNIIEGNTIGSNTIREILFVSADNNILRENTITSQNIKLDIGRFSHNNQIYNNNFIADTITILDREIGNGNVFSLPSPDGGNYYSTFDGSSEGCDDVDSDGFCDAAFVFSGGQDDLPWVTQDGWIVPDTDGDGIPDNLDACPGFDDNVDYDNDAIPDGCDSSVLGIVVQTGDVIDGKTLTDLNNAGINDNGDVVFWGEFSGGEGIFTTTSLLIQTGDVIDGKTLTGFGVSHFPKINNNGDVVFWGEFSGGSGVFTPTSVLVQTGDVIDGKTLTGTGGQSINDNGELVLSSATIITSAVPVIDSIVNVSSSKKNESPVSNVTSAVEPSSATSVTEISPEIISIDKLEHAIIILYLGYMFLILLSPQALISAASVPPTKVISNPDFVNFIFNS